MERYFYLSSFFRGYFYFYLSSFLGDYFYSVTFLEYLLQHCLLITSNPDNMSQTNPFRVPNYFVYRVSASVLGPVMFNTYTTQ